MDKSWYSHKKEYYLAIKRMQLQGRITKISLRKRTKTWSVYYIILYIQKQAKLMNDDRNQN